MEHHEDHPTLACDVCGLRPVTTLRRADARIVRQSAPMQELLRRTARFATSDAPVVITGESGTGKEVIARLLHENGPRATGPFVAVNVAALPAELLESELFGHARGAFTGAHAARDGLFAAAHGGTLFLDEIGEMPAALQAKLLRALAEGEVRRLGESRALAVDVRVLCATHRDLPALVRDGRFREDLYYRLKVLTLRMPPLRERREDVLPLALQFLGRAGGPARRFTPAATEALLAHDWPGNVRELENAVRHGAALASGDHVDRDDLPEEIARGTAPSTPAPPQQCTLAEAERAHVLGVLAACGGSSTRAARVLGIGRNTLWRKLRQWDAARDD